MICPQIRVVPNPFRQRSGFLDPSQNNRLAFVNIPGQMHDPDLHISGRSGKNY